MRTQLPHFRDIIEPRMFDDIESPVRLSGIRQPGDALPSPRRASPAVEVRLPMMELSR